MLDPRLKRSAFKFILGDLLSLFGMENLVVMKATVPSRFAEVNKHKINSLAP